MAIQPTSTASASATAISRSEWPYASRREPAPSCLRNDDDLGKLWAATGYMKRGLCLWVCLLVSVALALQIPPVATARYVQVSEWGSTCFCPNDGDFRHGPGGIAVGLTGNVYVADPDNNRVEVFDSEGHFITKWANPTTEPSSADGEFAAPYGIATDTDGNVYVIEVSNHRIQKFDANGNFILKIPLEISFPYSILPHAFTVDSEGSIWAPSPEGFATKFDPSGNALVRIRLGETNAYTTDQDDNAYIAGTQEVRKFSKDGTLLTRFDGKYCGLIDDFSHFCGTTESHFFEASALASDRAGHVFVGVDDDFRTPAVHVFDEQGNWIDTFTGHVDSPRAIAISPDGTVYVSDRWAVREFRYEPDTPPPVDSDGDGLSDDRDACPTVPATTLDGCPERPPVDENALPSPEKPGFLLRAIGDSVTAGFGFDSFGVPVSLIHITTCMSAPSRSDCQSPNETAYPAVYASRHGIVNARNFALSGSTPNDWLRSPTLESIVSDDPNLTLLTLGANPLLADFMLTPGGQWCARAVGFGNDPWRCITKRIEREAVRSRLVLVYEDLLDAPHNHVLVVLYPATNPVLLRGSGYVAQELLTAINSEIASAVTEVRRRNYKGARDRLRVVNPGPFEEHPCGSGSPWILSTDTCIHPNAEGHRRIADALDGAVGKIQSQSLRVSSSGSNVALRGRVLSFHVSVSEPSTLYARVLRGGKTGAVASKIRRTAPPPRLLGAGFGRTRSRGAVTVHIFLSKGIARGLAHLRRRGLVRLTGEVVAVTRTGSTRKYRESLRLREKHRMKRR